MNRLDYRPMAETGPTFSYYDFQPRYWGLWLGIGLLWLLVRLPHPAQLWLGRRLGRALYRVARERRRIAETNIALCFPERPAVERNQLIRSAFESFGISVLETGSAWLRGVDHLRHRFEIHGLEHLEQARQQGRGVLLIGAHFSTLDLAGALAARHVDMDVVYRRHSNPVFDRLLRRGRRRHFARVYNKEATRAIVRGLRAGRAIWYAPDQNTSREQAVFAPLFGVQAATVRATSRLAAMTGAPAVFCSHFRLDGGQRYRIEISPVLANFPSADEAGDAARINRLIEDALREHPEQYQWLHRRFKTRPQGEPPIYN